MKLRGKTKDPKNAKNPPLYRAYQHGTGQISHTLEKSRHTRNWADAPRIHPSVTKELKVTPAWPVRSTMRAWVQGLATNFPWWFRGGMSVENWRKIRAQSWCCVPVMCDFAPATGTSIASFLEHNSCWTLFWFCFSWGLSGFFQGSKTGGYLRGYLPRESRIIQSFYEVSPAASSGLFNGEWFKAIMMNWHVILRAKPHFTCKWKHNQWACCTEHVGSKWKCPKKNRKIFMFFKCVFHKIQDDTDTMWPISKLRHTEEGLGWAYNSTGFYEDLSSGEPKVCHHKIQDGSHTMRCTCAKINMNQAIHPRTLPIEFGKDWAELSKVIVRTIFLPQTNK